MFQSGTKRSALPCKKCSFSLLLSSPSALPSQSKMSYTQLAKKAFGKHATSITWKLIVLIHMKTTLSASLDGIRELLKGEKL